MEKLTKLHIGCGKTYLPEFVNVDLFSRWRADVYADMAALPFEQGRFELIYASHVLEHAQRHSILATLTHWKTLLRPGGKLRLAVPDFDAVVKHYQEHRDLGAVMGLLYGGQDFHKNQHFTTFTKETLTRDLLKVGFTEVWPWDWRKTEHSEFDDYSQAYLPHLAKEGGMLMSLNLEAVR